VFVQPKREKSASVGLVTHVLHARNPSQRRKQHSLETMKVQLQSNYVLGKKQELKQNVKVKGVGILMCGVLGQSCHPEKKIWSAQEAYIKRKKNCQKIVKKNMIVAHLTLV
jgi:hypothetical protein